jgi:hypothetical protein
MRQVCLVFAWRFVAAAQERQRDLTCPEAIVEADDEHPDLCLCLTFPPHLRPMFKLERGRLFATPCFLIWTCRVSGGIVAARFCKGAAVDQPATAKRSGCAPRVCKCLQEGRILE